MNAPIPTDDVRSDARLWFNGTRSDGGTTVVALLPKGVFLTTEPIDKALVSLAALTVNDKNRLIPLESITRVEGPEDEPNLAIRFRDAAGAASLAPAHFANLECRHDFLECLRQKLGTDWERETWSNSRFFASLGPIFFALIVAGATWFLHETAVSIAAGKEIKMGGGARAKLFRLVATFLARQLGPNGTLIAGGVLLFCCLLWLCWSLIEPGRKVVLTTNRRTIPYS